MYNSNNNNNIISSIIIVKVLHRLFHVVSDWLKLLNPSPPPVKTSLSYHHKWVRTYENPQSVHSEFTLFQFHESSRQRCKRHCKTLPTSSLKCKMSIGNHRRRQLYVYIGQFLVLLIGTKNHILLRLLVAIELILHREIYDVSDCSMFFAFWLVISHKLSTMLLFLTPSQSSFTCLRQTRS